MRAAFRPPPLLAPLLVAPLLVPVPARAGDGACARSVSVVGRASAARAPDFAEVTVGVEARGATAAAALDGASKAVVGLAGIARALDVPAADIGTAAVTLAPATRTVTRPGGGSAEEPDGYRAGNLVTVRVADMARLGDLLRRALDAGADRIDAIRFGLRDPDAAEADLQVAAARDARARAQRLAEAVGARLGAPCSLAAGGGGPQPLAARVLASSAAGRRVPVEAGTIAVAAEVTATFALAP